MRKNILSPVFGTYQNSEGYKWRGSKLELFMAMKKMVDVLFSWFLIVVLTTCAKKVLFPPLLTGDLIGLKGLAPKGKCQDCMSRYLFKIPFRLSNWKSISPLCFFWKKVSWKKTPYKKIQNYGWSLKSSNMEKHSGWIFFREKKIDFRLFLLNYDGKSLADNLF